MRTRLIKVTLFSSTLGHRPSGRRSRLRVLSSGFTLVELIIALALIGLITLLLFSGLRLGTRAWEGVEVIAERTAEPRIAHNFLARALMQARPAQVTLDAEPVLVFGGDAENLEFVAPLSEHVGTPGLYILRLSLEQGKKTQLVLTRWLLHPDVLKGFGGIPEWEPFDGGVSSTRKAPLDEDLAAGAFGSSLLLDDVGELQISYFGIAKGQREPDWSADWLEQDRMPLAIRMHLTTKEQTWPDMLVRLPQFDQPEGGLRR
ncbi:MAG: prepilin-type N-terminal cleavage/methylation domain-containing protein [Chromatiaceae bacterium]|jgi:general secretion pathway protein J|nr:prepilin-type N-terminal cleavage/methylation domain-containing protein [Chromatiaceae bacterium]